MKTGRFRVGDRVVKDPARWVPCDFDDWGRGDGVGVVVGSPIPIDPGVIDVRWPCGRCWEAEEGLLPAETGESISRPGA